MKLPIPDPELTPEQLAKVELLSEKEIEEIDNALLSTASHNWQKVAMIVGATMGNLPNRIKGIPDVFYVQRVRKLVENGSLESDGNLSYMMGRSEVRLAKQIRDKK